MQKQTYRQAAQTHQSALSNWIHTGHVYIFFFFWGGGIPSSVLVNNKCCIKIHPLCKMPFINWKSEKEFKQNSSSPKFTSVQNQTDKSN